ncbi:amidohydrolase family protein [Paenarthrobacter nitroguajacolicus]|uniref:amidohydrolase family protein n=1 Tax=Paenarthrobacter nitroguajacolicus TaxID=211146 RepID=UPI00248B87B6|nr:amidohydrolase family protein [Paenarthrobacter nitroguajacolicus]MDI2035897.1 hypothetical protein [Paenarthrobacter nitroguajacolicus]
MEIVDAQVHLWGAETSERPWNIATGHAPHGPAEYTAEALLTQMDAAGISAAFVVPPSFEGDRIDLVVDAAERHPHRFMAHGRWPLTGPDIAPTIEQDLLSPYLRGIRMTFNGEAARWVEDGVVDWVWAFAEERGIPVSLFPVVGDLAEFGPILRKHPNLKLSFDHLGTSVPATGFDTLDRINQLESLAGLPNIAVKASALPVSFPTTYSAEVVRQVVDRLMKWFGPERIFWGSDYTRYPSENYGETVQRFLDGIAHLAPGDQELIMGKAIRAWFDWESA